MTPDDTHTATQLVADQADILARELRRIGGPDRYMRLPSGALLFMPPRIPPRDGAA